MFPIKDDVPSRTIPFVTVGLVALNVAVFIYQFSLLGEGSPQGAGATHDFIFEFGLVPCQLAGRCARDAGLLPPSGTMLTSMFLHGGFLHLGGNMLYLWIFGGNLEDTLRHGRFVVLYLAAGSTAAVAQTALNPASSTPMIGASGAVSGVLGAYLLLFPRAKVLTLLVVGFLIRLVRIPAVFLLGFWFTVQFVSGLATWGASESIRPGASGEIAWCAHVGGFLAGMALLFAPRPRGPSLADSSRSW